MGISVVQSQAEELLKSPDVITKDAQYRTYYTEYRPNQVGAFYEKKIFESGWRE